MLSVFEFFPAWLPFCLVSSSGLRPHIKPLSADSIGCMCGKQGLRVWRKSTGIISSPSLSLMWKVIVFLRCCILPLLVRGHAGRVQERNEEWCQLQDSIQLKQEEGGKHDLADYRGRGSWCRIWGKVSSPQGTEAPLTLTCLCPC